MDHAARLAITRLAIIRAAYAKQVLASVGIGDRRVEAAFATVERERYLGPGPWPILRASGYVPTPDPDPVYLYDDILVGILPERGLNNGMPSYHAPLIASAALAAGEHVVHVGAGGWEKVTRLVRTGNLPDEQCWLRAPGWALTYY